MNQEGPALEALTRRIAECPADFLWEPRIGNRGTLAVGAIVGDLIQDLGYMPRREELMPFLEQTTKKNANELKTVLIGCWLLHEKWFCVQKRFGVQALHFLTQVAPEMARFGSAQTLTTDPDRREELARLCLAALGLRPQSETPEQAQDRLTTLSSVERARILAATRAAEERAAQIREAMRKKAAEEAAAKYNRE